MQRPRLYTTTVCGNRYKEDSKRKAVDYTRYCMNRGSTLNACADRLRISYATLNSWLDAYLKCATKSSSRAESMEPDTCTKLRVGDRVRISCDIATMPSNVYVSVRMKQLAGKEFTVEYVKQDTNRATLLDMGWMWDIATLEKVDARTKMTLDCMVIDGVEYVKYCVPDKPKVININGVDYVKKG